MLLTDLPGELVLKIVDEALLKPPEQESTGNELTAVREAFENAKVSKVFKAAVDDHRSRNIHLFIPARAPAVLGSLQPWLANLRGHRVGRQDYWMFHTDSTWPNTTSMSLQASAFDSIRNPHPRSVKMDARLEGFAEVDDAFRWSLNHLGAWTESSDLLARISGPNPNLCFLHLRLSAHYLLFDQLQDMIANSPQLTDIVIECDSHPEGEVHVRPVLRLDELQLKGVEYAPLDRVIIRAPSVDILTSKCERFLARLQDATTICFAVHSLIDTHKKESWVPKLLQHIPSVQRLEVSFYRTPLAGESIVTAAPIKLLDLVHLKLELGEIDFRLLSCLRAPKLKHLQIRSEEEVGRFGPCGQGHFPSLLCATVWCPGPVVDRFTALGISKQQFMHNLNWSHICEENWDDEVLIYVKPYQPPIPFVRSLRLSHSRKRPRSVTPPLISDS